MPTFKAFKTSEGEIKLVDDQSQLFTDIMDEGTLVPFPSLDQVVSDDGVLFDEYHQVIEKEAPEINQTTILTTYLEHDFVLPSRGNYLVSIWFQYSYDATNSNFEGDALVNGVTYQVIRHEPQDSGGTGVNAVTTTGNTENTGTDQRFIGVFKKKFEDIEGVLPVAIRWEAGANNVEAAMYRAILEVKRVD